MPGRHHAVAKALPYKREEGAASQSERGDGMRKAEVGAMQPQAKECRRPLEVGRDEKTDFPVEPPEGTSPEDILPFNSETDFGLMTSRTVT